MNISATTGNIKKANFGYLTLRRKKRDKDMKNQKIPSKIHIFFSLKKSHGTARIIEMDNMLRTSRLGSAPLRKGRTKTDNKSIMVIECTVLMDLLLDFKKYRELTGTRIEETIEYFQTSTLNIKDSAIFNIRISPFWTMLQPSLCEKYEETYQKVVFSLFDILPPPTFLNPLQGLKVHRIYKLFLLVSNPTNA